MSFISFSFILLFLAALLFRFWLGSTKLERSYLASLLILSLIFYASFVPAYVLLLIFTTLVDYYAGSRIFISESRSSKKFYLIISLTANLGSLCFFKYSGFILENIKQSCGFFGISSLWVPHLELVLPIGISFFTFQSMSYTIDIYRGQLKPVESYWRFLLFVSFFTHLVAGPIVRANQFLYQLSRKRRIHLNVCFQGFYLMTLGFFLKMVVADNIATYVNKYWSYGSGNQLVALAPLLLAILFSCQIFADFSGYSLIAMGAAYLLGFKLPLNFNSPYIASSFREFWTRWHITLSRWIRDYLYIPLGGNRCSKARSYFNLMLAMLLAGLWHGAAFTFLIWGGLHGAALVVERFFGFHRENPSRPLFIKVIWFLVVQSTALMAWIFFRSKSTAEGFSFISNIARGIWDWHYVHSILPAFLFVIPIFLIHLRTFLVERHWMNAPGWKEKGVLCGLMLYCIFTLYGKNNAFLYFQF